MSLTTRITYNSKTKLYKVDNGAWMQAWNTTTNSNISEFGFNQVGSVINIASDYVLESISPINYPFQYQMTIDGKTAVFGDYFGNNFNNQETFIFDITYAKVEDVICEDIYGNPVDNFIFAEDGIIYGVAQGMNQTYASINAECCTSLGYEFDANDAKCYWSRPCEIDDVIKIVLNPEGNDGALFQIDGDDTCTLDVAFDYLLEYDCQELTACAGQGRIVDVLSGITVNMTIERVNPSNFANETIYEQTIFNGSQLLTYFQNENSGVYLNGTNCTAVVNRVKAELGTSILTLENFLFSNWLHFGVRFVDESFLNLIDNQKIKLGIKLLNSSCETSFLIDNIELNRVCVSTETKETLINSCPSFSLNRVIDNKKSWKAEVEEEVREFELRRRETKYDINHHRLAINSKEVDININPARAIETDVMNLITENPCIFSAITEEFISLDEFKEILTSELIDAKSRQTISGYPTLRMVYDRYLYSFNLCGVQSNGFNYDDMDDFMAMIGNYWVELVEQVIPSTTIWGATYKYNNTIFDNNKFKYRKSTLFVCDEPTMVQMLTEDSIESDVTIVGDPDNEVEKCNMVFIAQYDEGSEFIGYVTVVGNNTLSSINGNTIILNEKID